MVLGFHLPNNTIKFNRGGEGEMVAPARGLTAIDKAMVVGVIGVLWWHRASGSSRALTYGMNRGANRGTRATTGGSPIV